MEENNNFSDIQLFDGKNLSDLFKDIYENHTTTKSKIKDLIASLLPLVEGVGDATMLVPLIKEYLEIGVKNDEQLVKLAQIVQRMDSKKVVSNDFGFDFGELESLAAEGQQVQKDLEKVEEESKIKPLNSAQVA